MIDYIRMARLLESDFDAIIVSAGGRRFSGDHSREAEVNFDFVLGNAVIELKIIEEEGLEKRERQRKLAGLFRSIQPERPTVILDPSMLDTDSQRLYYEIMSTPIKTAVKKASKQLANSTHDLGPDASRVLILINGGYAALSHEEFKDIALRRSTHDTSKIDAVVVGGIYYYSDTIEMFSIFPFETIVLNIDRPFTDGARLHAAWNEFTNEFMTDFIRCPDDRKAERLPVMDFEYELDGIRFVKPAPKIGKESSLFPHGRPRKNSTGIKKCPPVAHTFPKLNFQAWASLKEIISDIDFFKTTYDDWLTFQSEENAIRTDPLRPFVPMPIDPGLFVKWTNDSHMDTSAQSLCHYANTVFQTRIQQLLDQAFPLKENRLVLPKYILLVAEEIGQDKANDYGSITHIRHGPDGVKEERIIEHKRFFFEHGLAIAAAYSIKRDVNILAHYRSQKYMWT